MNLLRRQPGVQRFGADDEQLADLLFKRHAVKQRLCGISRRISAGDLRRVARLYYYLGAARTWLGRGYRHRVSRTAGHEEQQR